MDTPLDVRNIILTLDFRVVHANANILPLDQTVTNAYPCTMMLLGVEERPKIPMNAKVNTNSQIFNSQEIHKVGTEFF